MTFKADLSDIVKFTNNLKETSRSAYPLTVRSTLNKLAFETANKAKKQILPREFTLRNKFIQKTVQYKNCNNTFKIDQMESTAGQIDTYAGKKTDQLEHQEYGMSVISKGKYTKVPTPAARSGSYAKKVAPAKLIKKLDLQKLDKLVANPTTDQTKQIKQAAAFSIKHKKNFNIILTNPKGKKGIYNINNGKVKLLYSFKNKVTHIKKTKWLEITTKLIIKDTDKIFTNEANKRIEKELSKGLKR